MHRDRIAAEVPGDMAAWLIDHGSDDTWEQIGRDVAVQLGRRLLVGDPGTNTFLHVAHLAADSSAVRGIAATLGTGRAWSIKRVAKHVCHYFGLYSAQYDVTRRLGREQTTPADFIVTDRVA